MFPPLHFYLGTITKAQGKMTYLHQDLQDQTKQQAIVVWVNKLWFFMIDYHEAIRNEVMEGCLYSE